MLQAALVICRFYQDVAPNLAKSHRITYQADLERMLISQLEELATVSIRWAAAFQSMRLC